MIKINSQAMQNAFRLAVLSECETLTDWLWMQVQSQAPPEVRRDMIRKEIKAIGNKVLGTVAAGGMMALVTEWGSGSLADTNNPEWLEYTQSQYWNPARDPGKHTIRGRPEGDYIDLDGEMHHSSGRWEGRNLEWRYPPIEPQRWMQGVVLKSTPYIMTRLVQMVMQFPFHMYVTGDGR